jgi:hypothetical protein
MLTLERFAALAASYGADLQRWPEALRDEADTLLTHSPEARAFLAEARVLDSALAAGGADPDEAHWQEVALVRLRLGVEAEIAATRPPAREPSWFVLPWRFGWFGVATGSSLAVAAGLLIGMLYMPASSPDIVQTMFQPSPIDILAE